MAVDRIIATNREEILRICARHGAKNARIFGFFARGEAEPDSDVDLLVDLGPKHSSFFPGALLMDLQDLLGRHVTIVEPEALHRYIRDQV